MVIEFFGVPGAGKTSGARYISTELQIPLIKGGEGKIDDSFLYAIKHPAVACFFFWAIFVQTLRSNTWKLFRWRVGTILGTFSILQRASSYPGDTVVDEGLLQRVLSVYEEALTARSASRIVRLLAPDFVIYVNDSRRAFKRYSDDSEHPRHQFGSQRFEHWKEVVQKNVRELARAMGTCEISYTTVDDSQSTQLISIVSDLVSGHNEHV